MKTNPQDIARSIIISAEKIKNYSVQFTKLGDLAYNEMLIIDYLSENGDSLQKDIAVYHAISKQTINLSVKNLIRSGYIDIYQSPDNKKEKLLKLTDKGNVMKRYAILSRSKWRAEIVDKFGLEKAVLLESLLEEYESITGEVLIKAVDKHKEKTKRSQDLAKNEVELSVGAHR